MPKNDYLDFLAHHGILGQKWGVRRYQNPDGTLTMAGRKRYKVDSISDYDRAETSQFWAKHDYENDGVSKENRERYKKEYKKASKLAYKTAKKLYKANIKRINDVKKNPKVNFTDDAIKELKNIKVNSKLKNTDAYIRGYAAIDLLIWHLESKAGMKVPLAKYETKYIHIGADGKIIKDY